jgi:hypothetical protein
LGEDVPEPVDDEHYARKTEERRREGLEKGDALGVVVGSG